MLLTAALKPRHCNRTTN